MNKYSLQSYKGKATRHQCPACGDPHSFTYYVDEYGNILSCRVGRCNHESSCGYHYTPKEYFIDYPHLRNNSELKEKQNGNNCQIKKKEVDKNVDIIPFNFVREKGSYESSFILFLCSLFDRYRKDSPTIENLVRTYYIGATKDGDVIFWQMDKDFRVRTGKIMKYDPNTGKRIKDSGGINWVHSLLKKHGQLNKDWTLTQCLFGEHLLTLHPDKNVALVESEKSAIIAAAMFPDYIWLATGGKSQLSIDKLKVLKGRNVLMFPDADAYHDWVEKAKQITFAKNVHVSDILERDASAEEKTNKIDIADWMIKTIRDEQRKEDNCIKLSNTNPVFSDFIEEFGLVAI